MTYIFDLFITVQLQLLWTEQKKKSVANHLIRLIETYTHTLTHSHTKSEWVSRSARRRVQINNIYIKYLNTFPFFSDFQFSVLMDGRWRQGSDIYLVTIWWFWNVGSIENSLVWSPTMTLWRQKYQQDKVGGRKILPMGSGEVLLLNHILSVSIKLNSH